jgi:hypothetical protein
VFDALINWASHNFFVSSPAFLLFRYDDDGEGAKNFLQTLEESLKWEVRSLYAVLLGVGVRALSTMIDDPDTQMRVDRLGYTLLEYAVLLIMIMDASFSVIITAIFIGPIAKTLSDAGKVKTKSAGYLDLEKTMYMTLTGSTIAVFSSTILYVNLLMFFNGDFEIFRKTAFLNPLVFMGNIDSILNSVGMLLVSGIFKYLGPAVTKKINAATSKGGLGIFTLSMGVGKVAAGNSSAALQQPYVWNSRAYDEDDSDDDNDAEVAGESGAVPGYRLPPLEAVPRTHVKNTPNKIGSYKNEEKPELDLIWSPTSDKAGTYKKVEKTEPVSSGGSCVGVEVGVGVGVGNRNPPLKDSPKIPGIQAIPRSPPL